MRIVIQPSSASATKMAVISAPMILAIALPSLVLSHSSGYATRMPEADCTQVHGSSSWTRLPAHRRRATCPINGKLARREDSLPVAQGWPR